MWKIGAKVTVKNREHWGHAYIVDRKRIEVYRSWAYCISFEAVFTEHWYHSDYLVLVP